MIYLGENLRHYRLMQGLTQEEVAEALNVAPQTVSKWERSENYPDILLLPALANLFHVSVDALLGMERLTGPIRRGEVYTTAREYLGRHDWVGAVSVYREALHICPGDAGLQCDLAMALALMGGEEALSQAHALCKKVLDGAGDGKVKHTARAALCYILEKQGKRDEAAAAARQLPHRRESREVVQEKLAAHPAGGVLDALIYELSTGEGGDQEGAGAEVLCSAPAP